MPSVSMMRLRVIVVGCRIGGLAGKACDRYDTNLSKEN